MHVDDFQGACTNTFYRDIIERLKKVFKICKKEISDFMYTGVKVDQNLEEDEIILNQN